VETRAVPTSPRRAGWAVAATRARARVLAHSHTPTAQPAPKGLPPWGFGQGVGARGASRLLAALRAGDPRFQVLLCHVEGMHDLQRECLC
jgi:hypothetical protein